MSPASGKTVLGLIFSLVAVGATILASPAEARGPITLRACNNTRQTVLIGSSYIPIGGSDWRNKGWTKVRPHSCTNVFRTPNRTFYARAEVKGHPNQYWGRDIKQCVEYPGPYDFYTHSDDTTCPEGEPREFTTFHSDGRPVFVWNLDP